MTDTADFGPNVAESTIVDHPTGLDPRLYTDDGREPAPVWASSQRLREVVERQEAMPPDADRQLLEAETLRQLPTLGLYREVARLFVGRIDPRSTVSLYVILFPGEARDNTGIKDLNDNVLGYQLNSEYIAARQEEIRRIFPPPDDKPGPRFIAMGQDYKTASIVAVEKTPEDFAKNLTLLDARLRDHLLKFLDQAEEEEKKKKTPDANRLKEINKLRRTLKRDKNYRFDFLFGANTLGIRGRALDVVFQLLTEALKGAGIARFAAKGQSLTTRVSRKLAQGRGIEKPAKGHDPRGRVFRPDTFLKVSKAADDIKDMMTKKPNRDDPLDFRSIYVDTVWTTTFLLYKRVYFGNPDVIRDVRKKALVPPPLPNVKLTFTAQKELLELWLVTLNTIDFVKNFVTVEYPKHVEAYHVEGLLVLEELRTKTAAITWPRLARFLTRDIRQGFEPVATQGTASEFQFYSYASDYPDQIFFAMDIRDFGVELMAFYEASHMTILDDRLTGLGLMLETLRSTDVIDARRRFTYDSVVAVFKKYYGLAAQGGSRAAAEKAFGTALQTDGVIPEFRKSVQVMLGADEVFVAAHPYYARCEYLIIADLDKILFRDRPLNMRTGVGYSTAKRVPGPAAAAFGPNISDAQRKENQKSHDKILKLATDSLNVLKPLERTHRRIERLIDKLEANDKKGNLAPAYLAKLRDLHLMEMFVRANHGYAKQLSAGTYARLHRLLKAGDLAGALATRLPELVDFAGNVVDGDKLTKQAAELEAAVRRDVGKDNIHVDPPPVTKIPAWIQKIIDIFLPPEKDKTASVGSPNASQG